MSAPIRTTLTDRSGAITSGGTAQALAAANPLRTYLLIQNPDSHDLWINFTTAAVAASPSIKIAASGGIFIMDGDSVSTEAISVIGGTTNQVFTAKEG